MIIIVINSTVIIIPTMTPHRFELMGKEASVQLISALGVQIDPVLALRAKHSPQHLYEKATPAMFNLKRGQKWDDKRWVHDQWSAIVVTVFSTSGSSVCRMSILRRGSPSLINSMNSRCLLVLKECRVFPLTPVDALLIISYWAERQPMKGEHHIQYDLYLTTASELFCK